MLHCLKIKKSHKWHISPKTKIGRSLKNEEKDRLK
jgi:hypothetical protein